MALEKPAVPGGNSQQAAQNLPNPSLGSVNNQRPPQQQVQATKPAPQPNLATRAGLGATPQKLPSAKSRGGNRGVWIAIILLGLLSVTSSAVLGFFVFTTGTQINGVAADLEQKMQVQLDEIESSVANLQVSTGNFDQVSESVQTLQEQAADTPTKADVENNAEIHKQTDSDLDGISNYDEVIMYGTNPNDKDSDGDGFNDKAEIDNGFSPVGDGELVILNADDSTDSDATSDSASTGNTSDTSSSSDDSSASTSLTPSTSTDSNSDSSSGTQAFGN